MISRVLLTTLVLLGCVQALAFDGKQGHGDTLEALNSRLIHTFGKEGHGGHGVACFDMYSRIVSVQVYDLWESEAVYGLAPADYGNMTWKDIVEKRLAQLKDSEYSAHAPVIDKTRLVIERLTLLRNDVRLPDIDSDDELVLPRDCKKVTLASYVDDETILIDSVYWRALDEAGKAALVLHEGWYRALREQDGVVGSRRVRRINAYFMAEAPYKDPRASQLGTQTVCSDPERSTQFFVTREGYGPAQTYRIHFTRLAGDTVISERSSQTLSPSEFYWPPSRNRDIEVMLDTKSLFEGAIEMDLRGSYSAMDEFVFALDIPARDHRGKIQIKDITCNR